MTIDLSGRPPAWPPQLTAFFGECLQRAAQRPELLREPAPRGDELLRDMLGRHLGLDPEDLTITASLRAAVLTYARRSGRLRLERPTYPGVADTARAAGAEVTFHDRDELLDGPASGDSGAVTWLTAPCRNPDGAGLSDGDQSRIARLTSAGHRVVVNGTYAWFAEETRWPAGADVAGSLHKLCGVGARVGWVGSRTYFEEAFAEMLGTTPSRTWQHAWGLFLRDGGYEGLREAVVAPALAAAAAFGERLSAGHGLPAPPGTGSNLLLRLRPGLDEETALRRLEEHGFRLCPGRPFGADDPALRVSFAGVTTAEAVGCADAVAASGLLAAEPVDAAR